jgi:hypothetical protein
MRVQYRERPKPIKYADQIARERRAQGLLLTPPKPSHPLTDPRMVECVIVELKRRRAGARDNGKALVKWLIDCGVVPKWETSFNSALEHLYFCSKDRLCQVASALRLVP